MDKPNYLLHPFRPLRRRFRHIPGSSPGLPRVAKEDSTPPKITLIAYGPEEMTERVVEDMETLRDVRGSWPVVWVNVEHVEHLETIRQLGAVFGLHRLALEDVVDVPQRAKMEDYGDYLFIVGRMAMLNSGLDLEQIGIFVGEGFVLTFQERHGDPLDPVRDRLRGKVGRIRNAPADYLAYAVLDAVTDHYFPVLEHFGDRLDELEEEILRGPGRTLMNRLYAMKRDLTALRRAIWPARDALNALVRDPTPLVEEETRVYFRDCYDHVVQSIDVVESYRDLTSSLTDLYLSVVSHRTNEIMKVLTMFSVVFIPLTFIAGIYGMNFDTAVSPYNLPELGWYYGYPFALALMAVIGLFMLFYFWRKRWIGKGPRRRRGDV